MSKFAARVTAETCVMPRNACKPLTTFCIWGRIQAAVRSPDQGIPPIFLDRIANFGGNQRRRNNLNNYY